MLGKKLPPDEPIGESWEISCRNDDNNGIRNGPLAGKTLAEVFAANKRALAGVVDERGRFPLLNKFIDANALLSVQVHPDKRTASIFPGAEPKTEAWHIMHADAGATLIKGLKPGVTPREFEKAIRNDTVPELLNTFNVATGDMIFVPAGCVHAMGKGLVICEIQQNSDTTFRVYDWGRVGANGKQRELHVEQALESINFDDRSPDKVAPVEVEDGGNRIVFLVACPFFAAELMRLSEPAHQSTGKKRCESLMVVSGDAVIRAKGKQDTPVAKGDSALVPASLGDFTIEPGKQCELLRIYVPDIEVEIRQRLQSKGLTEEAIGRIVFD